MYLNQPTKPKKPKDILRKIYRKLQSIFGQTDFVPSGHFYSPIANDKEIAEGIAKLSYEPKDLYGIDLNLNAQLKLLAHFSTLYKLLPFGENKLPHLRYYFNNPAYCHSDGICLFSMLLYLKPKSIIEVGSGFSSALMHDVNERFFHSSHMDSVESTQLTGGGHNEVFLNPKNPIHITHIEPYPALLQNLLKPQDLSSPYTTLLPTRLQDVDIELFKSLEAGDILFIDSTHVSKINSDVNRIFFEILPQLKSNVYMHFHDIFYPFSYPSSWLREKNAWNESYLLRAFLSFNNAFEIVFFNTCLNHLYPEAFATALPLSQKNTGGSIWLRKL